MALPSELYREILQHISSPHDLCNLSIVSRVMQLEAEHFIYHTIELTRHSRTEFLCDLITSSSRLQPLVHKLSISNDDEVLVSRQYWERVARLLQCLDNLEVLKLHGGLASANKHAWVLSNTRFSLREFDFNFAFDDHVCTFLKNQPQLTKLYWMETSTSGGSCFAANLDRISQYPLPSKISELMTNNASLALLLAPSPTLTHVWICGSCATDSAGWEDYMDKFGTASQSVRSLRVNFPFGKRALVSTLSALAGTKPRIRSLGFIPSFQAQDHDLISVIAQFKELQTLVFWTAISRDTLQAVAEACPSLRLIACLHYSYSHEYVFLPVNPTSTPKAVHDPACRLWKDG